MKVSIVTTTKSKTSNIVRLVDSVYPFRKQLHEFIIVDAGTNGIYNINKETFSYPNIIDGTGSSRGGGKNIGIKRATGDVIAFLDDDTEITEHWIDELKESMKKFDIVAGYSPNPLGKDLPRVPCFVKGQDISYPSCNLAYKKEVLDKIGVYDENLITAEEMDLNYRAVMEGYTIGYNPRMIAKHYHRSSFKGFLKQAFWNGYGRKQLNNKHPELRGTHQHGLSPILLIRLFFAFLGYNLGGFFK